MSRKPQIKGTTSPDHLATPKHDNDRLVFAALFKVDGTGTIKPNASSGFLLNPDSMEDSKGGNWIENNIPGQSDPILQWVSGGARTLSFTALVTKDTVHIEQPSTDLLGALADTAIQAVGAIASAFAGVNIPPLGDLLLGGDSSQGEEFSIANYLDYYRSFMYPVINDDGVLESSPPLVVLAYGKTLSANSTKSVTGGISAGKTDLWVTKNVSIRITKWLPNLTPMEAEVSFELIQYIIKSKSSGELLPDEAQTAGGGGQQAGQGGQGEFL